MEAFPRIKLFVVYMLHFRIYTYRILGVGVNFFQSNQYMKKSPFFQERGLKQFQF